MLSHVWSSTVQGVEAFPIEVETHIETGLPRYTVVGLPDNAVRESRDRIYAALKNVGLPTPRGVITVNLAPADIRKEGSAFDLPIAIGLLAANEGLIEQNILDKYSILGELALDGSLRPVKGILSMTIQARNDGRDFILVPAENAPEASIVEGIDVFPIATIKEAYELLTNESSSLTPLKSSFQDLYDASFQYPIDIADVRGQENVKRALEVAAAGGHNVIMVGPPGSGKTMLAKRLPTILPPLSAEESLETTKIHSVGGKLKSTTGLVAIRPFRSPHHTISDVGLCGGGTNPMPGEISLAHNGVLFLDELPEFRRQVLEVMRQPLEEGHITISRARFSVDYPARFMLVASMNPCPCGYLNDPKRACVCAPPQVQRYLSRISGPLMDRIDLHIEVTPVDFDELHRKNDSEKSESIRKRVIKARQIQRERFANLTHIHSNAQMGTRQVRHYCQLDEQSAKLMKMAIHRLGLSARAYDRILKVARTIADLDEKKDIDATHISEAIQYRSLDRDWWNG